MRRTRQHLGILLLPRCSLRVRRTARTAPTTRAHQTTSKDSESYSSSSSGSSSGRSPSNTCSRRTSSYRSSMTSSCGVLRQTERGRRRRSARLAIQSSWQSSANWTIFGRIHNRRSRLASMYRYLHKEFQLSTYESCHQISKNSNHLNAIVKLLL